MSESDFAAPAYARAERERPVDLPDWSGEAAWCPWPTWNSRSSAGPITAASSAWRICPPQCGRGARPLARPRPYRRLVPLCCYRRSESDRLPAVRQVPPSGPGGAPFTGGHSRLFRHED